MVPRDMNTAAPAVSPCCARVLQPLSSILYLV